MSHVNYDGPEPTRNIDDDGEDRTYNGWTNRATWNVALWLREEFDKELTRFSRDRKIDSSRRFREEVEFIISHLDLKQWYLTPLPGCEIQHFMTPDAERFDDACWDELFEDLVLVDREEESDA